MPALAVPPLPAVTVAALASVEHLTMQGLLSLQGGAPCGAEAVARSGLGLSGSPEVGGAPDASSFDQYVGQSAGSGQCVALVQAVDPSIGATRSWSPGEQVRGNPNLLPGTVIATFDGSGRYANATDGSSHAAIYLGQSQDGVQVLDQWVGSPAAIRTIPWTNPSGTPANTGSAFRAVTRPA